DSSSSKRASSAALIAIREKVVSSHNRPGVAECDTAADALLLRHGRVVHRWLPAGVPARSAFQRRFALVDRVAPGSVATPRGVDLRRASCQTKQVQVLPVSPPAIGPQAGPGFGGAATRSGSD